MASPPSLSSAAIRISDDIPDSPYHHEHIGPSLSDVRSFDKSHTGNSDLTAIPDMYQPEPTEVAGEPPCLLAMVRDQGNSHKNAETAPGYYNNDGQAPSYGSIENRNQNSKPSGGYDAYDLPPSRNHVAPRKTSHTGAAEDDDRNVGPQPYGQMSVTGRKIKKIDPPAYYK